MALKQRKSIDKVELLKGGVIQVREIEEIYDTLKPEGEDDVVSSKYHRSLFSSIEDCPSEVSDYISEFSL